MSVRKIKGTVLMVFMSLALFAAAGSFPAGACAAETETAEASSEEGIVYTDGPTGFRLVDGKTYYYVNNQMQTGWRTIGGKRYYFTTGAGNRGVMKTGKRRIGGKWYCLDPDLKKGLIRAGDKVYFADQSGALQSGWRSVGGKRYYFTPESSRRFERVTGLQQIGNKWYFLDPDLKTGLFRADGKLYYANAEGALQKGWQSVNGKRYYFYSKNGTGHVRFEGAAGRRSVKKVFYFFDPREGFLRYGLQEMNGLYYFADAQGRLQTGFQTVNGKKMYFDAGGDTKYAGHRGLLNAGGSCFMCRDGEVLCGLISEGGETYLAGKDGALESGWKTVDGKTYYFLPRAYGSQPAMAAVKGCYLVDGNSCFFDENGVNDPSKTIRAGLQQVDGVWHYYYPSDEDGHKRGDMARGLVWHEGHCYMFDGLGNAVNGWQKVDGNYAWFDETGMYKRNRAAMKLTVIDYGNTNGSYGANWGDCTLLESEDHYLLLDTTQPGGGANLIGKLKEMGVKRLSIYISHFHYDHIGSLPAILRDGYFSIEKIYMPDTSYIYGVNKDSGLFKGYCTTYETAMDLAGKKGIPVVTLHEGDTLDCGLVRGRVIFQHADPEFTGDKNSHPQVSSFINNHSLVTMFECGDFRFLTAGDIEKESEAEILSRGIDVSADLFKLSHHCEYTSNTPEFLNAVNASVFYYTNPNDRTDFFQHQGCRDNLIYIQNHGGNVFHSLINGHTTFSVSGGSIFTKTVRRSKNVEVNVKNRLTGEDMTVKVRVQDCANGRYQVHENMIPFYCDLK
ncbi:MAG: hypothetical protein IKI23_01875 [Lachnospiraceae bacterium]|nr:hypothetical protein [Lachnospiraceae bacterium]